MRQATLFDLDGPDPPPAALPARSYQFAGDNGESVPPGHVGCNRCHLIRPYDTWPCPDCGCREYTLSKADYDRWEEERKRKLAERRKARAAARAAAP
jgi:hypothetical protein